MAECIISGRQGPKGDTGERGPQGEQGIQGPTGPQGSSATIKIANINVSVSNTNTSYTVSYTGILAVHFRGSSANTWNIWGIGSWSPFRIALSVTSSRATFTWATSGTGTENSPAAIIYTG